MITVMIKVIFLTTHVIFIKTRQEKMKQIKSHQFKASIYRIRYPLHSILLRLNSFSPRLRSIYRSGNHPVNPLLRLNSFPEIPYISHIPNRSGKSTSTKSKPPIFSHQNQLHPKNIQILIAKSLVGHYEFIAEH